MSGLKRDVNSFLLSSFSTLGCLLLIRTYWMRKIKWFDIKMGQQLPAHMHQYELVLFIYV